MEIRPRRKGMTLALVLEMKDRLDKMETVAVVSKEYPSAIENILKQQGVDFKVEEAEHIPRFEAVWETDGFEGYISGYVEKPKTFSTFIFTSALHVKP